MAWASLVIGVGLFGTGVATFLTHESDPNWYSYARGQGVQPFGAPSDGWAEIHGMFADAAGVLVLLGGAWFIYKVSFEVIRFVLISFVVVLFGHISGAVIRYNAVKLRGRSLEEADTGYAQIFSSDLEFMVTSRLELGATASKLWVGAHVLSVPLLTVGALVALRSIARRDPLASAI